MLYQKKNIDSDHQSVDELPTVAGSISPREDLIWEQFKSGDQKALTYIFQEYSNFLFNYGHQFSTDRNLIKDCLQDLFLDLIKHKKNLSATSSIKFYLMKSFRNKIAVTMQKNQSRIKAEKEERDENKPFTVSVSSELKMINGQLDKEKQHLIEDKLNQLPPLQREAILLYFYEGMKYSEIADLLGIRVKSARALIYRSLESLKEHLSPFKGVIFLLVVFFLI